MPSYPVSQLGLALWPRANARSKGNFEQSVARSSLRRVESKEFLFTEGDPVTHVFRVETGASLFTKYSPMSVARSWILPIRVISSGSVLEAST